MGKKKTWLDKKTGKASLIDESGNEVASVTIPCDEKGGEVLSVSLIALQMINEVNGGGLDWKISSSVSKGLSAAFDSTNGDGEKKTLFGRKIIWERGNEA